MAIASQPRPPRPPLWFEHDGDITRVARTCEQTCRRLAQACMELAQVASSDSRIEPCMHAVMDCSYVAAGTARILSRFYRHDVATIVSIVDVCARLAEVCASRCEQPHVPALATCAETSRDCARAAAALLGALESRVAAESAPPVRT